MQAAIVEAISAVADIATTVGVLFGIFGLVFVWLQLKHTVMSRDATLCLNLAQFSNSPDFALALDRVFNMPESSDQSQADRDSAMKVCVFFELVGAICNHGYMKSRLIEEFYGCLVIDSHTRLRSFVDEYRAQTGRPSFAANFEALAKRLADRSSSRGSKLATQ